MNVYRGSYKEASYEMSLNFGPVVSEVFLIKTGSRSFYCSCHLQSLAVLIRGSSK